MQSKFTWFLVFIAALMVNFSYAQEKTVSGTVSDQNGKLPGVNVTVKGTKNVAQTDFDGKYTIKTKSGDVLQFTYTGMKSSNVTVGASNVMNVTLQEDVDTFEDVVVTNSYNKGEKRSKITGSVATVQAKLIENSAFASFDQMLQGQAAGVTVQSGSGQPGAAAKVRIRGTSSISAGNDPLYILDGVPITANDYASLNANDFESISVLKDAASTAIYGSRASAGVIVITSKKGKFESDTQFTYRSQVGFAEIGNARFTMMNSDQLLRFQRASETGRGFNGGVPLTDAQIAVIAQTNTNWSDVFFRTGVTQSHELSMRGGGEKTRFFNSLSYFDQEGVALRSSLKRFTLRSNFENKASETVTVGANLSLAYSKQTEVDSENSVTLQNPYAAAYLGSPYDALYNPNGTINVGLGKVGGNAFQNLTVNDRYFNQIRIIGGLYAEKQIVKNLVARVDFGADYTNDLFVRSTDPTTESGLGTTPGNAGAYRETSEYTGRFNTTSKLVYTNRFADKHDFQAAVYVEYLKEHFRSGAFSGFGINPKLVGYPAGITTGSTANGLIPTVGGANTERGLFSYFSTVKYGYDDRYNLDLSIRRDASSRFADDNQWGTFYAVGANWNITNESFLKDNTFIKNLVLRASYGTTGNETGIGLFQSQATWGAGQYGGNPSIGQTGIPNPALQWEEAVKSNIGLDFSILKGRITGTVEYYENQTNKLFVNQQLPFESGQPGGSLSVNAGSMSNKGVDLSLEGFLIQNKDVSFSIYGNFNYNKNVIEDLGQVNELEQGTSIIREGIAFGSHYVVGWAGVNPANGQPLYYDRNKNVTNVFSAANSTADWGSYEPVYSGGFGSRFNYKGFEFSTLFTFAAEYFRFNNQTFFAENPNFSQFNSSTIMTTMWQNPGDITEVQSYKFNREFSSKDIEDASFLRLRNITVAYNVPAKFLEKTKTLQGVRFYLQAQNLATWTRFTGFDPEDNNNIAQFEYPTPRIVTFGLDVKF